MTSVAHRTAPEPSDAGRMDALVSALEVRLRASVAGDGLVGDACAHLIVAPAAKRARPRLLFQFAALVASGPPTRFTTPLVDAAAAVELIHTASLLHDDVVDEASARRGVPSVNARWGNSAAVLAGDVLLSRALHLLAFDTRATAAAIDVVSAMSVAAVREVEVRGRADLDLPVHAEICDGKTAVLFGLCGRLVGIVCGDEHAGARFETAGRALGLAFQFADDVGDVETDLLERTPTHPILSAAACDPTVARDLAALWAPPRVEASAARELAARILCSAGPSSSLEVVRGHVRNARAALEPWAGASAHAEIFRFASTLEAAGRAA